MMNNHKKISLASNTISLTELDALADWIRQNPQLTKGELCLKFEKVFAEWQGSKYALFVNSGSSANLVMIYSLLEGGWLKNKKVVAPGVSWVTTVAPFIQLGFDITLCDCNKSDLGLDVEHFEDICKKERPALAILVHVLGHANMMKEIMDICRRYDVILLEDSCEALGSVYNGKHCGSLGKAGSFSFYYGHHISTIEGGMVVTDDEHLYNIMQSIRSHGWSRDISPEYHQSWTTQYNIDKVRDLYTFYFPGFNLRSTDLNAFIGLMQIDKIAEIVEHREKNFKRYKDQLGSFWHQQSDTDIISSFAYGTLVENREETYNYLRENGIESRPLICGNIGRHPFWQKHYGETLLPNADIIHDYGLYVPNHYGLQKEDVTYVCDRIKEIGHPYIWE